MSLTRVASAAVIGTTIEWYDFFIYGTASALVFNRVFFPETTPLTGTLLAFSTFAVGFIARPLGAIVFGHFGDRYGRKATLVVSLLAMGLATFAIGLLPSYGTAGALAPLLLVLMRLVQGFAVGGEWGGAALIGVEHAPPRKKVLFGSFAQLGSPLGLLLATAVFQVVALTAGGTSPDGFAWRVPFLLSVVLVPIGLFIRLGITESKEFAAARRERAAGPGRVPLVAAVREAGIRILIGFGAFSGVFVVYYLLTSFTLVYATETLKMPESVSLPGNLIAAVVEGVFVVVGAVASLRFDARRIAILGAAGLVAWSFPAFALMNARVPGLLYLAVAVAMVFIGLGYGVLAGQVAQLFAARVRYTGSSLSYHLGGALGGGLAPVIATYLLDLTGSAWPIAGFCVVIAVMMLACCVLLPRRVSADGEPAAPRVDERADA
jgi:MFS family permease